MLISYVWGHFDLETDPSLCALHVEITHINTHAHYCNQE